MKEEKKDLINKENISCVTKDKNIDKQDLFLQNQLNDFNIINNKEINNNIDLNKEISNDTKDKNRTRNRRRN